MKLRQLKHDSDPDEMLDYLKKRHPLYFMPNKLNHKQIEDLVKKLIFKVKQQYQTENAASKAGDKLTDKTSKVVNDSKQPTSSLMSNSSLNNAPTLKPMTQNSSITQQSLPSLGGGGFKSGSQLPSISSEDKKTNGGSSSIFTQNKQKEAE